MVCKLKRSLYVLKQSGRNWYECLAHQLEQLGFHSSQHDNCLSTQKRGIQHCWARFNRRGLRTMVWGKGGQTVHDWWLWPSCVVPGHCIQSGTRRFDVEPQTVHIKLADEVRNAQLQDRFNSLTREVCTKQRRPARRRFRGCFEDSWMRLPRTSGKPLLPGDDDETWPGNFSSSPVEVPQQS